MPCVPGVIGEAGSGVAVALLFLEAVSMASGAPLADGEDVIFPFQLRSPDGDETLCEDDCIEAMHRPYGLKSTRNVACR